MFGSMFAFQKTYALTLVVFLRVFTRSNSHIILFRFSISFLVFFCLIVTGEGLLKIIYRRKPQEFKEKVMDDVKRCTWIKPESGNREFGTLDSQLSRLFAMCPGASPPLSGGHLFFSFNLRSEELSPHSPLKFRPFLASGANFHTKSPFPAGLAHEIFRPALGAMCIKI